ncbi:MAG: hypothetical protein KDD47_14800, partial [Acidobacteria bacterium]|nr:hypothetical protein [Acidobacteriota bacterium]
MEAIYILFALAMLGAILLGPVFGFIGWLTSRENRRRLERLAVEPTRDLIRLHQRIDELERRLAAAMAAGEAAPVPPGETPVATERIVEARATVPAEDRPAEQSASLQVPREADSATAVPETAPQGEGGGVPAAATPEPAEGAEGPRVAFPEGRSPADSGRPEVVVDSPGEGAPATTAAPEGAEPRKEEGSPPPLRTPPGGGGGAGIDWERWIGLRG